MIVTRTIGRYQPTSALGPPPQLRERLSRQLTTVALMVADGYSDKQIESALRITHSTLRIYIDRIRKAWDLRKNRNVRTEITKVVVRAWARYEDELTAHLTKTPNVRHDKDPSP